MKLFDKYNKKIQVSKQTNLSIATNTNLENSHLNFLDGIRGIAAFLVVIGHFRHYFFNQNNNSPFYIFIWSRLNYFFLNGAFCVELFFVLSGFVLTYNYVKNHNFIKKQVFKRVYRLVVPVILSLLIYLILIKLNLLYYYHKVDSNSTIFENIIYFFKSGIAFFLNSDLYFISINSSLWTIPIELFWSYLLFVIFIVIQTVNSLTIKSILFFVSTLIVVKYSQLPYMEYGMLFCFGGILAINYENIIHYFSSLKIKLILLILILLFVYAVERDWLPQLDCAYFKWSNLVALLLIFLSLIIKRIQLFFSTNYLKWLGKISFALYLLHISVLGSISTFIFKNNIYMQFDIGLMFLLILSLCISLASAHLFTVFIDEPSMKIFDKYYKKITNAINRRQ